MNYLIDTHVFIWFINGDDKLPLYLRELIEDTQNRCYISIASFWEMAIKVSAGNLYLTTPFEDTLIKASENGLTVLDVRFSHIVKLSQLPFHHRDPFDRTIIAQGLTENFTIITKETIFTDYGVQTLW